MGREGTEHDPLGRALWFIESNAGVQLKLEDVAAIAGVSAFHLTRLFGFEIGYSVVRYVRNRRLTQAAHRLAAGERDILSLALDSGYGSHEAFSRAFRGLFGISPKDVRSRGHVEDLNLVEASTMKTTAGFDLSDPTITDGDLLLLAGLSRTHSFEDKAGIPAQWREFAPHMGTVAGRVGGAGYGVVSNSDDEGNYDYLCAVEVTDFSRVGAETARLRLPEQRYAVFEIGAHVSTVRAACSAIWGGWFPQSGHDALDAPFFERYPESFDGETGEGGYEIWVPLRRG